MYEQDNDESDCAVSLERIGPRLPWVLRPYMGNSEQHCLNLTTEREYPYNTNIWRSGDVPVWLPSFVDVVERRGDSYPIMFDGHHNFPNPNFPVGSQFRLVLRLDGSVKAQNVPFKTEAWEM